MRLLGVLMHLHSGLHFVHTSSGDLPAAGLLFASNHFVSQNTYWGETGWLFNTLQPHKDHATRHRWKGNHKDWARRLWLNSPHFSLSNLLLFKSCTSTLPLSMADCQSRWGPLSLPDTLFSLIVSSRSYPVLIHLPCWVLSKLLCLCTTCVYCSLYLETFPPIHTGSTSTTLYNTPSTYWDCPTTCSIDSHIIWFNPYHPYHPLHTSLHVHTTTY